MKYKDIIAADSGNFELALKNTDTASQCSSLIQQFDAIFKHSISTLGSREKIVTRINNFINLMLVHEVPSDVYAHVVRSVISSKDEIPNYGFLLLAMRAHSTPCNRLPAILDTSAIKPHVKAVRKLDVQSVYKLKDLLKELDEWHTGTRVTGNKPLNMKDYPGKDALRCRDSIRAKISEVATPDLLNQLVLIAEDCLQDD